MLPQNYFLNIIDPHDPKGPTIQAEIPHSVYSRLYKYYPVRYENLRAAKYVLENPKRIFSGVRQFNEGGWCFTGKPRMWYIKEDVQAPFPNELVFAVYLNANFRLYEARAEPSDRDDPLCPDDWQNRYGGLIWKTTS